MYICYRLSNQNTQWGQKIVEFMEAVQHLVKFINAKCTKFSHKISATHSILYHFHSALSMIIVLANLTLSKGYNYVAACYR